jgi:hypothetical protein
MATQKSLAEQVRLDEDWELSLENIALLLGAIEARLKTIEIKGADFDVVRDQVLGVLLARINEVLTPQINAISNIVNMGFLIAYSDSSAALAPGNVLLFTIEDEEQRMVFTPSPRVSLSRVANYTDYAIAQVSDWNRETGELVVVVEAAWGNPGPFTDWVIAALPGDTLAAIQAADEAITAMNLSKDWAQKGDGLDVDGVGTRSAKHYAGAALASASAAGGSASTASGAATTATGARDTAVAAKDLAVTKAAEAAASAALISGGPVTSINYKTGVAFTDPTKVTEVKPTLDFDLTNLNGAPFFDSFSRPSIGGYRRNHKGVIVPTTFDEPYVDRDTDGKAKGTGFFGAYSNLLVRSEEFDNAVWTKTNVTPTANSTIGADGAQSMDTLNATVNSGVVFQNYMSAPGSTKHRLCVRLKQGTAAFTRCYLGFLGGSFSYAIALIDWSAKTVSTFAGGATSVSASLVDLGGGIYELTLYGVDGGSANTYVQWAIEPAYNSTGTVIAGQAELTQTSFAVPYMPTTSAAAARSADSMIISGTDFTDIFNPLEGTFYCEFAPGQASGFPGVFAAQDGPGTNRIGLLQNGTSLTSIGVVKAAGVDQATLSPAASTLGVFDRVSLSYAANMARLSRNGAAVVTDSSVTLPTGLSALIIGYYDAPLNGFIRRLIYWPEALSANELQWMTA